MTESDLRIAVTGGSGFVGSATIRRLSHLVPILDAYRTVPAPAHDRVRSVQVDVSSKVALTAALKEFGATTLINFAAAADVDACERDAGDWTSAAYQANAVLPNILARACHEAGVHFIHLSTDYVFSGNNGPYDEEDQPDDAVNWYGQTKLEGERAALRVNPDAAIVRISTPYGDLHTRKIDIVQLVRRRLSAGQPFTGAVDSLITPTWLGDVATGLAAVSAARGTGVYHVSGSTILSPYEVALIVSRTYGLDESLISPVLNAALAQPGRAVRPLRSALFSKRLQADGDGSIRFAGIAEGVGKVRDLEAVR